MAGKKVPEDLPESFEKYNVRDDYLESLPLASRIGDVQMNAALKNGDIIRLAFKWPTFYNSYICRDAYVVDANRVYSTIVKPVRLVEYRTDAFPEPVRQYDVWLENKKDYIVVVNPGDLWRFITREDVGTGATVNIITSEEEPLPYMIPIYHGITLIAKCNAWYATRVLHVNNYWGEAQNEDFYCSSKNVPVTHIRPNIEIGLLVEEGLQAAYLVQDTPPNGMLHPCSLIEFIMQLDLDF